MLIGFRRIRQTGYPPLDGYPVSVSAAGEPHEEPPHTDPAPQYGAAAQNAASSSGRSGGTKGRVRQNPPGGNGIPVKFRSRLFLHAACTIFVPIFRKHMASSNFVDYVKIFARSGHGGSGSAHFRREKFVAFGGPDGGDGGKGGSIVLQGDSQYWTLIHLKYQRHQFAEDGQCGSGARSSGKDAKDIVIPVPLGTVARRIVETDEGTTTELVGEVTAHGERLVLLNGGRGGLGNWHFKSATNQTPRYAQPGEEGEEGAFVLELKVLADVGLVGFPNAGKSTLLSVVSAATPKIANYAFTTLEPNLGLVEVRDGKSFVMADIPGIIEGAHEGRGLGTRFLRHIERNSVLLFMIPADSDDIRRDYEILLGELTQYNPELLDKERLLAITKCDMLDEELIDQMKGHLPQQVPALFISSVTGLNIRALKDMLWEALQK